MDRTLIASLRNLLAKPDRPDRDALFAVLADEHVFDVLASLAPTGTLAQIAEALHLDWSWCLEGWERLTDDLVSLITDRRCPYPNWMIETWSRIPNAVGILRDRTNALVAWAERRYRPEVHADLATLLGPSDEAARLLLQSPSSDTIGQTLRRWSMSTDPGDPTAWQAMIESPDLRAALHQSADPSQAFPAWGWDDAVDSGVVLDKIVDDLFVGWSLDHPSIRGRIGWLEDHVGSNLDVGRLAVLASTTGSDVLVEAVCARLGHDPFAMYRFAETVPFAIYRIAETVPWSRLHPRIQAVIDTIMRQESGQWTRTWACAIGESPLVPDTTIDAFLLLWRIDPERWEGLDPSVRNALVSSIISPDHCYGWGVHPDLVGQQGLWDKKVFRFWNPNVPPDDLRAWAYASMLCAQKNLQAAHAMIALLDTLPPDRRMRFEQIIDWRLSRHPESPSQPPWDWAGWVALPAADRQQRLRARLAVLRGDRDTLPAVRFWRARNDGLATLALMVGEVLGLDDPTPILAALIAQVLGLRGDTTDVGPSLPFPDDLDAALRAQMERLPLSPNEQAYAAWCLLVLARRADVGFNLIALHPDVAVALAPILNADQQKAVAASPTAQGWDSGTHQRWVTACAAAQKPTTLPRQRRL